MSTEPHRCIDQAEVAAVQSTDGDLGVALELPAAKVIICPACARSLGASLIIAGSVRPDRDAIDLTQVIAAATDAIFAAAGTLPLGGPEGDPRRN